MARATTAMMRCALLAAVCLASAVARADEPPTDAPPSDEGEARARALFIEGRDRVQRGDIEAGCAKLRESHALSPDAVGPLLNVADCDERAGRLATAWARFQRAASLAPEGDRRRDFADKRAASVGPRVPRLVLRLAADAPPGTEVLQDGKVLPSSALGTARPLDPGTYRIEVRAPGRPAQVTQVVLVAGATETRVVSHEPTATRASVAPNPSPAADSGPSGELITGFTLSGIGGLLLMTGIVTGIMVGVKAGEYEDHCQDGICDEQGLDAASVGKALSVVSPLCLATGAVSLGIGIPLWLTSPEVSPRAPKQSGLASASLGLHLRGALP